MMLLNIVDIRGNKIVEVCSSFVAMTRELPFLFSPINFVDFCHDSAIIKRACYCSRCSKSSPFHPFSPLAFPFSTFIFFNLSPFQFFFVPLQTKNMSKSINILDKDYVQWINELSSRYRRSQIKAAVKVNQEMLQFYWELGRDIVERDADNRYGSKFYASLSRDLKTILPDASGLSERNLYYTKRFYCLYNQVVENLQQVVALGTKK